MVHFGNENPKPREVADYPRAPIYDKECAMTAPKPSSRLRELLKRPELLVMSGGFSPLHARMSEVLGYQAFFMSGSQVAAYVYGYPDVGLLGVNEMVESVRRWPRRTIWTPTLSSARAAIQSGRRAAISKTRFNTLSLT